MEIVAVLLIACASARAKSLSSATIPTASTVTVAVEIEMSAVGDIRLDGPVADVARRGGDAAPTSAVKELLAADIVMGNLETPITTRGVKTVKTWNFRAPARLLKILKSAGFTVLNIANNHVWDYGEQGFRDTLSALTKGRWTFVGGGRDRSEAEMVRIIKVRGVAVGVLGLTSTHPEQGWAGPSKPGVAYSDYNRIAEIVHQARSRCDVLIVNFHGGTELADLPNEIQTAVAHSVISSGADIFIGHHPHVLQPVELYNGKPILYSLGNFLFVSPSPLTQATAIVRIRLAKGGIRRITFIPIDTNFGQPRPASVELAATAKTALNRLGAFDSFPDLLRFKAVAVGYPELQLVDPRP